MKKLFVFTAVFLLLINFAHSQGCIMVRNISGFGQYNLTDNAYSTSSWQLNIASRYFKSYHDYKGTVDQKTPEKDASIVRSFSLDLSATKLLENGWSLDLSLPLAANSRSATTEHGGPGTARHSTHTFGIGDVRFTAYKWLLKPSPSQKGNLQLGLGLKLPTGDYKYQDYFYRNDSTKVLAPVNASIQLGDGGTGIITELNGFYFINKSISFYGNIYYLTNPRDQSGVSTTTGKTPTALDVRTGNSEYSVPDVYSIRGGVYFNLKNVSLSAGFRDEGVPVHDLVGGSNGLRRPGHNLSVEPGILYKMKTTSFYVYLPFIVARKIKQNVPDAMVTKITGNYKIGPGGSGDYQVFAGVLFKL
ncbi:MAG: transporter [Bacteroidota bacterium]|nr:transporter [Bacteroidota bacterium]